MNAILFVILHKFFRLGVICVFLGDIWALRVSGEEFSFVSESKANSVAECPGPTTPAPTLPSGTSASTLYQGEFRNWIGDLVVPGLWNVVPESTADILDLVNWAHENNYKVRPSGFMHTWAPVTVSNHIIQQTHETANKTSSRDGGDMDTCPQQSRIILVKTNATLVDMNMVDDYPFPAVWVQSGATLESLLEFLEQHGYGVDSHPATGHITMGGIMAIGGHGTGVAPTTTSRNSTQSERETKKDHGYGSMSNLILAFTAIVWNPPTRKYIMKTFDRSNPESQAFITSMGRAFILDMTLKVSNLTYLRCQSRVDIPARELFSDPAQDSFIGAAESIFGLNATPPRSISSFVKKYGRVEAILFPFTDYPWLKIWSFEPDRPPSSIKVNGPYNYPFSDSVSLTTSNVVADMTLGNWAMAPMLADMQYSVVVSGLNLFSLKDLWGSARNLLLYVRSSTFRLGEMGTAIVTSRDNLQIVIFESFQFYKGLIAEYAEHGKFPINGPLDVRVSGLDWADEMRFTGDRKSFAGDRGSYTGDRDATESPGISPTTPVDDHSDFDICIWFTILSIPGTPYRSEFFQKMEAFFYDKYDGSYALARPEWSKGWAYSEEGSWRNGEMLKRIIPSRFKNWQVTRDILNKYDPHHVFTNPFLNYLFQ